jgi:hypothetical protein
MSSLSTLRAVLSHGEADKSFQSWAKLYPLLAALIAPITSLLDIPALTVGNIHASFKYNMMTIDSHNMAKYPILATLVCQIWRSTAGFHGQHRSVRCRSCIQSSRQCPARPSIFCDGKVLASCNNYITRVLVPESEFLNGF